MLKTREYFMNAAIQEATKAFEAHEVPVGAIVVKDDQIIGRGYNRIEALQDASAHAEIIAIGAASSAVESWRLNDCDIYITLEPCIMCLGAILQSRIQSIIYAVSENRFGALTSNDYQTSLKKVYGRFPAIYSGVLEYECKNLLQEFFKQIRK